MKALTATPAKRIRVWDKDWRLIGTLKPQDINDDGSIALDHYLAKWIMSQALPAAPDFRPVAHCSIDEHGQRWIGTLSAYEALKVDGQKRFKPTWQDHDWLFKQLRLDRP